MMKNNLFKANVVSQLFSIMTSALLVSFVYSVTYKQLTGEQLYQLLGIIVMVVESVCGIITGKNKNIEERGWKNFKKFLIIEGVANLILGTLTIVFRTPIIYFISTILLTPLEFIQKINVKSLENRYFSTKEEILEYEKLKVKSNSIIYIIGLIIGIILGFFADGPIAYGILALGEILNNIFYYKALKEVENR